MAKEKITFDITDDGIRIDSENFSGDTCLKELESFRKFLKENGGIDVQIVDQQKKPAFYQRAGTKTDSVKRG